MSRTAPQQVPQVEPADASAAEDAPRSIPMSSGTDRGKPRAIGLTELGLVILLGVLAASLLLNVITPLPTPGSPVEIRAPGRSADLSVFDRFDPFVGSAPEDISAAPVETETRLNLTLLGTHVGARSSAVIRGKDGKEKPFFVGDTIAGGVRLVEVKSDRVILSRNGLREALSLERRRNATSPRTRSLGQRPAAVLDAPIGPASRTPSERNAAVGELGGSLGELSRFVRIQPNPNGQGIVLFAGASPDLFEGFGLRDGDILVAVNNRPVPTDPSEIASVLSQLSGGAVSVVVERNGTPISLSFDLSERL